MGKETRVASTIRYSFRASLPVMAGYLVLGAGFGVLLQSKGYGWPWALLMSVAVYAGSMQYVAIDLLAGGASLIAAALMTLMINLRHLFYGITMLPRYRGTGAKKPYLIFSLTDETFSLVCSPELPAGVEKSKYYLFVSLLNQCYWVLGSLAGGILGSAVTFNTGGMDFAMTALFVVIFLDQWEKAKTHLPALTGVTVSLLCLLTFGPDDFLIPAMLGITLAMFLEHNWLPEEGTHAG
ncbi:MAG: AzlC family ABC transporter permease [Oscillospiraceae bacterium]|nr:AzlC family ABC transporter permease [Oscillospiraceae bacterium]